MKKLLLNKKIYKRKALFSAMKAFEQYLKCSVSDKNNCLEVTIQNNKISPQLIDEFLNYVLGATKKCL